MNKAVIWIALVLGLTYITHHPKSTHHYDHATTKTTTTLDHDTDLADPKGQSLDTAHKRVVVIGDSLTVGMTPYWPTDSVALQANFDAQIGRPLRSAQSIVARYDLAADSYVLALGTNDCMTELNEQQIRALINATTKPIRYKPVLVLTLGEHGPIRSCAQRFNAVLRQLSNSSQNLKLGDWQALARDHPEWYGAKGDGIHLTGQGYQARAMWLHALLAA